MFDKTMKTTFKNKIRRIVYREAGSSERLGRLNLAVLFGGRVKDIKTLYSGRCVSRRLPLATVVHLANLKFRDMSNAPSLDGVWPSNTGLSIPYWACGAYLRVSMCGMGMGMGAVSELPYPELASVDGRLIAVRSAANQKLTPEGAEFSILFPVDQLASSSPSMHRDCAMKQLQLVFVNLIHE